MARVTKKMEEEDQKLVGFTIKIGAYNYTVVKIRRDIDEIEVSWKDREGNDKGTTYLSMHLLPWLKNKAKEANFIAPNQVGETLELERGEP
jgi:hypothetical protein